MLSRLSKFLKMRSKATRRTLTRSRQPFQSTMSFTCRHLWSIMRLLIQSVFNWSRVGTTHQKLSLHIHQVASSVREDAIMSSSKSRSRSRYPRPKLRRISSSKKRNRQLKRPRNLEGRSSRARQPLAKLWRSGPVRRLVSRELTVTKTCVSPKTPSSE